MRVVLRVVNSRFGAHGHVPGVWRITPHENHLQDLFCATQEPAISYIYYFCLYSLHNWATRAYATRSKPYIYPGAAPPYVNLASTLYGMSY